MIFSYVCIFVCMLMYVCTYVYMFICIFLYVSLYECMFASFFIFIVCMYVRMYDCTKISSFACLFVLFYRVLMFMSCHVWRVFCSRNNSTNVIQNINIFTFMFLKLRLQIMTSRPQTFKWLWMHSKTALPCKYSTYTVCVWYGLHTKCSSSPIKTNCQNTFTALI